MLPSCDKSGLIPVESALETLLESAQAVTEIEEIGLDHALNRVLAQDIESPIDVPPFHASAMDGYAVNSQDYAANKLLPISQRIAAGEYSSQPLAPGTAARIFTGAPLPEGADTVVMQESCEELDGQIKILEATTAGQFVRAQGSHVGKGDVVLHRGCRLGPAEIGLVASMGIESMPVYGRLKVALLTTGDELIEPGEHLKPGQIYNANHYLLTTLLQRLNCDVVTTKAIADTAEAVETALRQAADQCDLIISSGGVSVGEEDHVKAVVERLGELALWRIRLKPGKPLAFGQVMGKPFIGLPGNPVSSLVTFCLFARPFVLLSQGMEQTAPISFPVEVDFAKPKPDRRREYMRVSLHSKADGKLVAHPFGSQDSATLLSTTGSDGLLCIPEETTFEAGEQLWFTPFSELLF